MMSLKFLRLLFVLAIISAMLAGCSELLFPPTVTPVPTPVPRFGMEELRNVFENLPEGYVEVDPNSRDLGSANFNDAFDLQLAFLDSAGRSNGFSVSLGVLSSGDEEAFDYTLEKEWGTADADLVGTSDVNTLNGLFWLDVGDIALGSRYLERASELRESIAFRRGEVGVVVQFAQELSPMRVLGASGSKLFYSDDLVRMMRRAQCGSAYICYDREPDFITGPKAATMIDEAIVRFYGGLIDSADK